MSELSGLIQTVRAAVEAGGTLAVATVEGVLLIVLIRALRKAGPVLLELMKEEHASHQTEVTQITSAHKEALIQISKDHREALRDLMDRHERQMDRLLLKKT